MVAVIICTALLRITERVLRGMTREGETKRWQLVKMEWWIIWEWIWMMDVVEQKFPTRRPMNNFRGDTEWYEYNDFELKWILISPALQELKNQLHKSKSPHPATEDWLIRWQTLKVAIIIYWSGPTEYTMLRTTGIGLRCGFPFSHNWWTYKSEHCLYIIILTFIIYDLR